MQRKNILISADELSSNLDAPDWVVIDCRLDLGDPHAGRNAYRRSHIPGAVYFDLDKDLAGPVTAEAGRHPLPDPSQFAQTLGAAGIGNDHSVVVYDGGNGAVAARAWWLLRWLGHERAWVLDGGFGRWQALGLAEEQGTYTRAPVAFHGKPRPELVITTAELASDPGSIEQLNLLDARDGSRFHGENEPIDPVAGHIPGAKSVPFGEFVNTDGTWSSLAEREQRLLDALGCDRNAEWCVMCGSGVTACHLVITGLEAGFREPRVYVGSWSEWIRDPGRPVVVG